MVGYQGFAWADYFSSQIGGNTANNAPKLSKLTHRHINTVFAYAYATLFPQQSVNRLAGAEIFLIGLKSLAK